MRSCTWCPDYGLHHKTRLLYIDVLTTIIRLMTIDLEIIIVNATITSSDCISIIVMMVTTSIISTVERRYPQLHLHCHDFFVDHHHGHRYRHRAIAIFMKDSIDEPACRHELVGVGSILNDTAFYARRKCGVNAAAQAGLSSSRFLQEITTLHLSRSSVMVMVHPSFTSCHDA